MLIIFISDQQITVRGFKCQTKKAKGDSGEKKIPF